MNSESQWIVYRTRFLVRARQLTEPLVFTNAVGREQYGEPGDYLVEFSDGIRRITTQALFEDIYVPITEPYEANLREIQRRQPGWNEMKNPVPEGRPDLAQRFSAG
jgi:hypothetical protein